MIVRHARRAIVAARRTEFGLRGPQPQSLTGGDSSTGIAAVLVAPKLLLEQPPE